MVEGSDFFLPRVSHFWLYSGYKPNDNMHISWCIHSPGNCETLLQVIFEALSILQKLYSYNCLNYGNDAF